MSHETEMEIMIGDEDQTVTVEHEGGHHAPANFGGHPDSWHPDESEDPQILSVLALAADGATLVDVLKDLSEATLATITRKLWEGFHEPEDRDEPDDYDFEEFDY